MTNKGKKSLSLEEMIKKHKAFQYSSAFGLEADHHAEPFTAPSKTTALLR